MIRAKENSKGLKFAIIFIFVAVLFFLLGFVADRWYFAKDAAKTAQTMSEKKASLKKTDSGKKADDAKKVNPVVGEEKEDLTFYKTLQNGKEPPPLKQQKTEKIAQKPEVRSQKTEKLENSEQKKEEKKESAEHKGEKSEEKKQKPDNKENKPVVKNQESGAKDKKTAKEKAAKKNIKNEPLAKDKRFTLQIAAFKDKDKAEDVAGGLKKKGYESYIVPVTISAKGVWYRVRIGRFATRPDAQNMQTKLKKSEGISAFITFTTE